jgi:Zn-dependent M16 (insulinase) family peptidase
MSIPSSGAGAPGFELISVTELDEFRSRGIFVRHIKTGCEIYHVLNADEDNLFSFTFKTPPRDNSGAAHILEHSVLCGSQNFPAKDPFLLLLKGSMNTYMNAFTFPDKTVYPASSQVEEDFFNLFRVYGDAVFFPLLRREAFMQEGQRREFSAEGKLEAVGIVYNEMKGNYSSHDSIAGEWAYRSLFPDTPYGFDSGGEPAAILDLSYEDLRDFHAVYYHPSNCRIFLYGNIPTEKHLHFLEENFLSRFEKKLVRADIALPERWSEPRFLERLYPAGEEESAETSSSVTVNWLLSPVEDPLKILSLEVLTEILLGNAGSPLQKALVDSGLGEDLSPATGIETGIREITFSVGLRGTSPARRENIENLIFKTLEDLSLRGIDPEQIEGALRRVEFRSREIKAGSAFGMRLMSRALRGWLHGKKPELMLEFRRYMEALKEILARDKQYFQNIIETELLHNTHRTSLVVKPDPGLALREATETREKLAAEAFALGEDGLERLRAGLEKFRLFQENPDSPEALASIPSLNLNAIPRRLENIPTQTVSLSGIGESYAHDLYTNAIVYADLAFDLETGGEPDIFLPLFASALTGVGAGGRSYDRIALDLSLKTGGFQTQIEAGPLSGGTGRIRSFLFLRLKSLEAGFDEALDLVRTILLEPDFDDEARLRDIFLEYRNEFKSSIIPNGHFYASSRAERGLSSAERLEELWKGLSQYQFVAGLSAKKAPGEMIRRFGEIRQKYISRNRFIANFTCPENAWSRTGRAIEKFAAALPESAGAAAPEQNSGKPDLSFAYPRLEGISVPSSVSFVATAVPASLLGQPEHAHESVLAHLLSTGHLWEKIRMKGGAYGAFCTALGQDQVFSFASYRDPNIVLTFEAFREAVAEIAAKGIDAETAKNAVIGTAAKKMKPLSPGGKSIVAFRRSLYDLPDELRQRHQDYVLNTKPENLVEAARRLSAAFDQSFSAVIASKEALASAAEDLPDLEKNIIEISL